MQVSKIKTYLKQNKITYDDLSAKSGIPIGTIKSVFSGRTPNPRIDTVQAIERALGLAPSIFTEDDYANGVTDSVRIDVNTRQYEWLELGDKIYEKGADYYNTVVTMIEAIIKQK